MVKHTSMTALCFVFYMIGKSGNITEALKPREGEYF